MRHLRGHRSRIARRASAWGAVGLLALAAVPAAGASGGSATPVQSTGPAVVRAETAALLLSDQTGGPIPIDVLPLPAGATDPENPEALVETTFLVETSIEPWRNGPALVTADLFLYVLGERNRNLGHLARRLEIHPRSVAAPRLTFRIDLPLPPGKHRARALLRTVGGAFGMTEVPVAIGPSPGDSGEATTRAALPPLLQSRPGQRLIVPLGGSAQDAEPSGPQVVGARPLPAVRPELGSTDAAVPVQVVVPDAGALTSGLTLRVVHTATGDKQDLDLSQAPAGDAWWPGHTLQAMLDPLLLVPGTYRLEVFDSEAGHPTSPATEVRVTAPASDPWAVLGQAPESASDGIKNTADINDTAGATNTTDTTNTADTTSPKTTGRSSTGPQKAPKAPKAPKKSTLVRDYLEVLDTLAAGREGAALHTLTSFETRAVAARGSYDLNRLANAQASTLAAISQESRQILLPVALLHLRATTSHYEGRRTFLSHHGERLVRGIAESLAETPAGRVHSAQLLGLLALQAQRRGTWLAAQQQFRLALEYDPAHVGSLLSLGTLKARMNLFEEAEDLFAALLTAAPDHAEGRLRRALVRLRDGDEENALPELRELSQSSEDWVAVLATQELVREITRAEAKAEPETSLEEALQVLDEGLRRWPEHPILNLQKAYLLDRQGNHVEAARLLPVLDQPRRDAFENERFLFNRWPHQELERDRSRLHLESRGQLQALAQALQALPGRGRRRAGAP